MLTDNQKLWVDALRSGEYAQTEERLNDEDGFCCLGVACDVYAKATKLQIYTDAEGYIAGLGLGDQHGAVMNWLGLHDSLGISKVAYARSLSVMNDYGSTFEDIADCIEASPEEYFYGES